MQRTYDKYIDQVIVNNDFDITFRQIVEALDALTTEHQWVPVNWIYWYSTAIYFKEHRLELQVLYSLSFSANILTALSWLPTLSKIPFG